MLGNGIRDNEVHAISGGQVVVVAYYTDLRYELTIRPHRNLRLYTRPGEKCARLA